MLHFLPRPELLHPVYANELPSPIPHDDFFILYIKEEDVRNFSLTPSDVILGVRVSSRSCAIISPNGNVFLQQQQIPLHRVRVGAETENASRCISQNFGHPCVAARNLEHRGAGKRCSAGGTRSRTLQNRARAQDLLQLQGRGGDFSTGRCSSGEDCLDLDCQLDLEQEDKH